MIDELKTQKIRKLPPQQFRAQSQTVAARESGTGQNSGTSG